MINTDFVTKNKKGLNTAFCQKLFRLAPAPIVSLFQLNENDHKNILFSDRQWSSSFNWNGDPKIIKNLHFS